MPTPLEQAKTMNQTPESKYLAAGYTAGGGALTNGMIPQTIAENNTPTYNIPLGSMPAGAATTKTVPPPSVVTSALAQQDLAKKTQYVTDQEAQATSQKQTVAQNQATAAQTQKEKDAAAADRAQTEAELKLKQDELKALQDKNAAITKLSQGANAAGQPGTWATNPQTGMVEFTPTTTGTSGASTGTTSTEVSAERQAATDQAKQQLADIQAANDKYNASVTAIQNGTYPLTPSEQGQLDSITAKFNTLIQQQKDYNKAYEGGVTSTMASTGRSYYTPDIAMGEIQGAINAGQQKIADLERQKSDAITTLKTAIEKGDYEKISAAYKMATDASESKTKILKEIADQADLSIKEQKQSQKDIAISDLILKGITNPNKIITDPSLKSLNVTLKDVTDAQKNLADSTNTSIDKLSANVQEFYKLKGSTDGLPVSVLAKKTTGDQILEWLRLKKQAETTPTSLVASPSGTIPVSSIDKNSKSILEQTGLSMPAFGYLTQGPTALTRMNASERVAYMQEVENWANNKGIDVSTFKSQYEAYNTALQSNIKRVNNVKVAEGELKGTLDNLSSAADDASFRDMKIENVVKLWAGQQFNDANVSKYAFHLNQLRSEMALYNAAASGKPSTDQADYAEAEKIIKDGFAAGSVKGFQQALTNSVEKMDAVLSQNVDRTNKQVWDLFGVGENFQGKTSPKGSADDFLNNPIPTDTNYSPDVWSKSNI